MEDTTTTATAPTTPVTGALMDSLVRSNKDIKKSRAEGINEDLLMSYRQKIDNLRHSVRSHTRGLDDMLDLSPTNTQSLILAADFKPDTFYDKRQEILLNLRNDKIKLELAEMDFEHLFGYKYPTV